MANRIIKESIHTSEDVNRMTDFQFRLWVSLITYVDDYGRGDARPAVIKGQCFPLRDRITVKDIDAALAALAGIGCVGLYEVDGKPYLYFPAWESHQRIQSRKSKYPEPAHGESRKVTVSHGESPSESNPNTIQSESESNPNPKEKGACAPATGLEKTLLEFSEMRKRIKAPLTDEALKLTRCELEKLAPGDEDMQIEILQQSIQRGWRGVFPLKSGGKRSCAKNTTAEIKDDLDYLDGLITGSDDNRRNGSDEN